ncbi:MAG: VWA domain-containing protein [Phycisphaerales bacterium]|nr:VWA domain-containing protein [Phycisphaerales bacterium]
MKCRTRLLIALTLCSALFLLMHASSAAASGVLVVEGARPNPLQIHDHLVRIGITDRVALTTINQTFLNTSRQRLEATYIFPIPEGADLTDFRMTFNGKMVEGEVLPADKAREIYERIVRGNRDPGLIEFIGRRLLRARIFPIEPGATTEIQLSYQQVTDTVAEMWRYQYPLRTPGENSIAHGTVRFDVTLASSTPLRGIWSPTHEVEVVRDGDTKARVAFERNKVSLADDFILLYDAQQRDVGLSVVTYRESEEEPGHFLLLLAPKPIWDDAVEVPQDYVFVVDTSGSMASDDKMEQARQALNYCIDRLEPKDRFSVVRFSTGFDLIFDKLQFADKAFRAEARNRIERFKPSGGTNINDALKAALALRDASATDRPFVIIFLTDGKGDQTREVIEDMFANQTKDFRDSVRLFPFGVGHDVNTKLLDALATGYGGIPTYVQPGENLEHSLGDFFSVFSEPVLTDLRLTLPDAVITEQYPPTVGDLYHGRQILLAGQFEKAVKGAVTLKAKRGDKDIEYVWPNVSFEPAEDATYVPRLWAGRKIAYLIDRIRLDGESTEMVREIVDLSTKYSLQTPYTSWLVAPELRDGGRGRGQEMQFPWQSGGMEGAPAAAPTRDALQRLVSDESLREAESEQRDRANEDDVMFFFGGGKGGGMEGGGMEGGGVPADAAGERAFRVAAQQARLREGLALEEQNVNTTFLSIRRIDGRTFVLVSGYLVDSTLTEEAKAIEVQFGSVAYFDLITLRPDLRKALAASRFIVVMVNPDTAIVVRSEGGVEKFDDEMREEIKAGAPKR